MYQRILVPVDGSPSSNHGLDEAIKLAKITGASLLLIHLVDALMFATGFEVYGAYAADLIPKMREFGEQILQEAKTRVEQQNVQVDCKLFDNLPERLSEIVADQARRWPADLIVIGTHGRRGVGRMLLGSDAEQIARTAPVPVLLVRAPEDTSKTD